MPGILPDRSLRIPRMDEARLLQDGPGLHILIIGQDDSQAQIVRQAIARRQAGSHPDIEIAPDFASAKALFAKGDFDLFIVDPHLPGGRSGQNIMDMVELAKDTPVAGLLDPEDAINRSIAKAMERRQSKAAALAVRDQSMIIRRLQEVEELKTRFYNSAAHELHAPLTPIRIQLHLLKGAQQRMPPDLRHSVDVLDRNVERLTKLTQELLDVARLQSGTLRLSRSKVDLGVLIAEASDSFGAVAESQKVDLETRAESSLWMNVDGHRLSQVVYNLVGNAIKFTPAGGRVSIEAFQTDIETRFLIHDTGLGLVSAQRDALFKPFGRAHEDIKGAAGGTGLGLFISKGIVELHGGKIWCDSAGVDQGSTFGFSIPRDALAPQNPAADTLPPPPIHRSPRSQVF